MIRLSVQIEFDKTMDLVTHKSSVIVGRSPKCDLVIPHDSISRQHCQIDFIKDQFFITDLGSSNGVSINGQKITPQRKTLFPPKSQLAFGKMECELVSTVENKPQEHTIVSSNVAPGGDFTATIRLARLELNKPSITLELEKKQPALKRPRNPVTYEPPVEVVKPSGKKYFLFALGFLILALAWIMGSDNN